MLVCIGYDVDFELEDGRLVQARGAMLYDKTGVDWPYVSILVQSFERADRPAPKDNRFARDWFGRKYDLKEGDVRLPSRELGGWRALGAVERILYTRGSGDDERHARREGGYEHSFSERGLFDFFTFRRPKLPELFRRGGALRLEIWTDYGVTGAGIVNV